MPEYVYITPYIYRVLCEDAQQLHRRLLELLEHGPSHDAEMALRNYFIYHNGFTSGGRVVIEPCPKCSSWLYDPGL